MGLFKTAARAAVATSVHGKVRRRQHQRWAAEDQAAASAPTAALHRSCALRRARPIASLKMASSGPALSSTGSRRWCSSSGANSGLGHSG